MELSKVQWNGRAYAEFRDYLLSFSDEKYRAFHRGLCKTSKYPIIGVRLPIMQKISSEIVKGKPLYFLMAASVQSYEEIMIRGLVTATLKMPLAEKFVYIEEFLPYIDNWAVCDSFCTALKLSLIHISAEKCLEVITKTENGRQRYIISNNK